MRSRDFIFLVTLMGLVCLDTGVGGEIRGKISSEWLENRKDILIFIEEVDSAKTFEPPKEHPTMDQKKLTFIPHILPIVVGTTVDFSNNDSVHHNVFSHTKTKKFDLGNYPPHEVKSITFNQPGTVALLCNAHPEMSACIIVLKNPYFALTDRAGRYVIPDVPTGTYRLSTWCKTLATATKEINVPAEGALTVNFELTIGDPADLVKLLK